MLNTGEREPGAESCSEPNMPFGPQLGPPIILPPACIAILKKSSYAGTLASVPAEGRFQGPTSQAVGTVRLCTFRGLCGALSLQKLANHDAMKRKHILTVREALTRYPRLAPRVPVTRVEKRLFVLFSTHGHVEEASPRRAVAEVDRRSCCPRCRPSRPRSQT